MRAIQFGSTLVILPGSPDDERPEYLSFKVGDIVTRGGDDRQRITYLSEDNHNLEVVCTKAPASGWCKVGETESNLCRRYSYPSEPIEGQFTNVRELPAPKGK